MARKRNAREIDDDDDVDEPPSRRRRRRPRWRRRALAVIVVALGLAVFGPTIVAKTPLRDLVLTGALPGGAATITATDANFSWVAGQSLAGVTLKDPSGQTLATVESLTVDRSLVALAANSRHLGKIVLVRPTLRIETRDGGSNIEDLMARLAEAAAQQLEAPSLGSGGATIAEIEVVEGTVMGRDNATGQQWVIQGLAIAAHPNESGMWDATAAGRLALAPMGAALTATSLGASTSAVAAGQPGLDAGRFKLAWHNADRDGNSAARQLDVIADRLPLAPLEPWLGRLLPAARILGVASADLKITRSPSMQAANSGGGLPSATTQPNAPAAGGGASVATYSAAGKLDAADVRFTAAALAGDLVELSNASIAIDATADGPRITSKQFTVRGDWIQAEATGKFDVAQFTSLSTERLPSTDAMLTARVDLPQLARMLPRTLQLRPSVRIDSGRAEITARSSADDSGRHWTVAAAIENLVGADGSRQIRWTQPVEAGVDLTEAATGPQVKRVLLRSPFAQLAAEGADGGLEGEFAFNLDDLAEQLGQFVDLTAWQLRGTGAGKFSWRDAGADKFAASANVDLANIDVQRGGKVVWVDPELHVQMQSSGLRLGGRSLRIDVATALMRGTRDSIEAELLEPVDLAADNRQWFVRIKGDGPLDSWAGRLRPWIAAVPAELSGQATLNARLRLGAELVDITQSQLSVRDFRTVVAGKELLEDRVEAGGDFRWSAARRSIESQDLQLASSTVAARARGFEVRLAATGPPTVRGEIAFRGDFERIAAWSGLVGVDGGLWPRGQGVGRMQLASDAERATANLSLAAEPFALVRGAAAAAEPLVAWSEPKLQLGAELAYTHADDRLQLANLRLDGQTVHLTVVGAVESFRTAGVVRADATITYDSAELAKLLAAYLGPGVRIQGAKPLRLVVSGRIRGASDEASHALHWSRRLTVAADSGWEAANLYGLPIGPAALVGNVRDGQIQINPLDLAVGEGRLTVQPRVLLDPPPQELQLAPGPLASNVAVSAEVSDAMLKYAAPILASATRISGKFSLYSEGVQVPLGEPKLVRAKGRLTMHQLAILPGPGLEDVVTLIQRLEQASRGRENLLGALAQPTPPVNGITMNERTIDVQVVDGRVYHRNLEFLIDDVPVRSYGSVGFDQSLALVIQVPVQEKWVRGTPALQGLIGQVIEIPVHGTMTRWNVDQKAIGNFLAQAAQSAVGGALENELNKALEGLFRRK